MVGKTPNWYWKACWVALAPLVVVILIILSFIGGSQFRYEDYIYPVGFQVLGHILAALPLIAIVGWFVFRFCYDGGYMVSEFRL